MIVYIFQLAISAPMSHLPSAHVTLSLHSELLLTLLVIGTPFVLHYK